MLKVYNSEGTCIESVDVNSSSYTLNVKNHPPGIYMLVTQSANNKYAGAKFSVASGSSGSYRDPEEKWLN